MLTEALTKLLSAHDLPEPPPADPMPLLIAWYEEARASGRYDDFNAMSLATASADGAPSVRVVLCKGIETVDPAVVFYTHYESCKGRDLAVNPRAAAVFHWPHLKRQTRIAGDVERLSAAESDAYFATRPLLSRIGASISPQSSPLASRALLMRSAMELAKRVALGASIPRPPHWGGYRIRLREVELWSGRDGRLHQRVLWRRVSDSDGVAWEWSLLAP